MKKYCIARPPRWDWFENYSLWGQCAGVVLGDTDAHSGITHDDLLAVMKSSDIRDLSPLVGGYLSSPEPQLGTRNYYGHDRPRAGHAWIFPISPAKAITPRREPAVLWCNGVLYPDGIDNVRSACEHPNQFSRGCADCLSNYTPAPGELEHMCGLKTLGPKTILNTPATNALLERADTRAPFRAFPLTLEYISPQYTHPTRLITPNLRSANEHYFPNAQKRIQQRKDAARTGSIIKNFRKNIRANNCPHCLMKDVCDPATELRQAHTHTWYPGTETQAESILTERYPVLLTDKELLEAAPLLGVLPDHVTWNRARQAITLRRSGGRILLGRIKYVQGAHTFEEMSLENVKRLYREHSLALPPAYDLDTQKLRAVISLALSWSASPRFRGGWRSTIYPVQRVQIDAQGAITVLYSHKQKGGTLQWNLRLSKVTDAFKYYSELPIPKELLRPKKDQT